MKKPEVLWEDNVRREIPDSDYELASQNMALLAAELFSHPQHVVWTAGLLLHFQLGATLHWHNLDGRNLIPEALSMPRVEIELNTGGFMYDPRFHSMIINTLFLVETISGGPPDEYREYHSITGTKPLLLTPAMTFFLGGIEEVDHAAKVARYQTYKLPGYKRSDKRYYSSNHEFTALGWQIYYARLYGMPENVIMPMKKLLHKTIRYRKSINLKLVKWS